MDCIFNALNAGYEVIDQRMQLDSGSDPVIYMVTLRISGPGEVPPGTARDSWWFASDEDPCDAYNAAIQAFNDSL